MPLTARMKLLHRLEIYPIIFVTWTVLGFAITFTIGTVLKHFSSVIPAISRTGEFPPENGIFTFVVTISAFLFLIISTIRFEQIVDARKDHHLVIRILNFLGYLAAILVIIGILLVGSFDLADRETLAVHNIGAFLVYVPGFFYYVIQAIIGPFVKPMRWWRWAILIARIALLLLGALMFILFLVSWLIYRNFSSNITTAYQFSNPTNSSRQTSLSLHNLTQWLMVGSFYALAFTFIPEFSTIELIFKVQNRKPNRENTLTSSVPSL